MAEEGLTKTDNDLIHIGKPIPFSTEIFLKQMETLAEASYSNCADIRELVKQIVTTYHPAEEDLKIHGDTYKKLFNEAVNK